MHIRKKSSTFAPEIKIPLMEKSSYTIEELRASVEEGTRQIESGRYYTDAQVDRMLDIHHRQLA